MGKEELKKNYVHYYKPASPTDYPKGYEHVLVTESTAEQVVSYLEKKVRVAGDTETTGLNYSTMRAVGAGFCGDDKRAFYFPFRHKVGQELNLSAKWLRVIYERVLLKMETLWFNFPYDGQLLENENLSVENMNVVDVMNMVWITDSNWKSINLKWAAKHFLGWDVETFEQLLGGVENFSYLHPNDCVAYACTDPLINWHLYHLLYPTLSKECPFILKLDNKVVLPLIRAHQVDQTVDKNVLVVLEKEIEENIPVVAKKIYDLCGRVFEINSSDQVARVLEDLGIDTGERTKGRKGQGSRMGTRADALERVEHPIAKEIVYYRQLVKWRSSFVEPLMKAANGGARRFNYFICGVPTGRFKAGKDEHSPDWFIQANAQAILKPHVTTRFAHYVGEGKGVLGWEFNEEKSDLEVEFPEPKLNVRKAIIAPPGYLFVSIDYSGQELRIPANLSGEPSWIKAFQEGKDLHGMVAQEVYGEVNKDLRKKAKVINFGIIYGMSSYSYAKKVNCTQEEGDEFFRGYKGRYRRLFAWIEHEQRQAARSGVCHTAFGRPRRLYHWFSSPDRKVKDFARRSAVNDAVQGTAADIFRISFVNMYHRIFKKYVDKCQFRLAVHDEIDFILRKDSIELLDEIVEIMTVRRKDWPVAMEVGVEIGTSWGDMVKFEKRDGVWKPVPK